MKVSITSMALTIFLIGCGGSGGDGGNSAACEFVGGSALAGMSVGSSSNVQDSVDRNLSTFASISSVADGQLIAGGSSTVEGGGNAGLFVTPPAGTTAAEITINTRIGQRIVESASGPALNIAEVSNAAATNYIGFTTSQPYEGIEFLFSTGGEYLVYEFCHRANLN